MAVSPVNADRHGQTKNMERQCDRHRNTPFTEDSGDKPPVAVLAPLGFKEPYLIYHIPNKMSNSAVWAALDKSGGPVIIKITKAPRQAVGL